MKTFEVTITTRLTRRDNELIDTSLHNHYEVIREVLGVCDSGGIVEVEAAQLELPRNPVRQAPQPVSQGRSSV